MHRWDWRRVFAGGLLVLSLAAGAQPPPGDTPGPNEPLDSSALHALALERVEADPQQALRMLLQLRAREASHENTSALLRWLAQPGRAVLCGHTGPIMAVAFSPDGQQVATAGRDGTVRLWNGRSGTPGPVLSGHEGPVTALAYHTEGDWLATGDSTGTVRLWNPETGELLEKRQVHSAAVRSVVVRPGTARSQLVTTAADGSVYLWRARDLSAPVPVGGPYALVHTAAFDAEGSRLLTTHWEGVTREWDADSGEFREEWFTHGIHFQSLTFSPDGEHVLGTDGKGRAVLMSTSAEKREEEGSLRRLGRRVVSASFGPDGNTLLTVSADGTAEVWSGSGQRLGGVKPEAGVHVAFLSPKDSRLLTLDHDGAAALWASERSGDELERQWEPRGQQLWKAAFSPDGSRLVTASMDGTARLWELPAPPPEAVVLRTSIDWRERKERSVVARFSPDGQRLLTLEPSSTVRLWEVATGEELWTLPTREQPQLDATFDAEGKRVATLGRLDGRLQVWDAATGWLLRKERLPETPNLFTALFPKKLPEHEGRVAFSPRGESLLTGFTGHEALLWTVQPGQARVLKHTASELLPVLGPDGRHVATAGRPSEVLVWSVASDGVRVRHRLGLPDASAPTRLAFSPDGRLLAVAAKEARSFVQLWEVETGRMQRTLEGHQSPVTAFTFSPEGDRLLTTSEDGEALLWEVGTGVPLATLRTPGSGAVRSAAFSPDGQLLLTVGDEGTLHFWKARGTWVWTQRDAAGPLRSATFTPDGRRVLAVGEDGQVRFHACALCEPPEVLEARVRPRLSREPVTCPLSP